MLDKHDITLLEGVLDKKLKEQLDKQDQRLDRKLENLKLDLRDEFHSTVSATETRMIARMDRGFASAHRKIVDEITGFISDAKLA